MESDCVRRRGTAQITVCARTLRFEKNRKNLAPKSRARFPGRSGWRAGSCRAYEAAALFRTIARIGSAPVVKRVRRPTRPPKRSASAARDPVELVTVLDLVRYAVTR